MKRIGLLTGTGVAFAAVAALAGCGDDNPSGELEAINCDVVIVGGGAGGLHTAFRLAPELGDGVCLFEKEAELGGRIHDVALDPDDPDSPRWGTGALRVMQDQQVLFDLAAELDIELEFAPGHVDMVNARGLFGFSKDEMVAAYPQMSPLNTDPESDQETMLYDELRMGSERANSGDYPDFRSYIRNAVGAEEFEFLRDVSRFRADFEYPLDAEGYLDYLDEEWDVCCDPSYPVGGMSSFIRGMAGAAEADGVRVFLGEPVTDISRHGAVYQVSTGTHLVTANKVVIAAPPVALQWITGDVVEEIAAQQEFKDIIAVKVVTVTQWWPTDWWTQIVDAAAEAPNNVWRAWTTDHCINFIEIPVNPYGIDQKVTRSVYDDDINCVEFWDATFKNGGIAAVEAEIERGLRYLFNGNGITTPTTVTIPDPVKTHVQIWPAAWHWLRAGTELTNAEVFDWSVEPLSGEDVSLVGEAYYVNRSGWSDAAYKSSIRVLNERYGLDLPGLARPAPRAWTAFPRLRSMGGH